MSTTKGRKIVKDANGNGIYFDTVPKKSALQAILMNQDAIINLLKANVGIIASGSATLSAGAATVAAPAVTANSLIMLTVQTVGGTPGSLKVTSITAGTGFNIGSSSGTETSVVGWVALDTLALPALANLR